MCPLLTQSRHYAVKHSCPYSAVDVRLLVQNHIQQRTMDFYAAVVVDKTQFSKFVHESTDARSRRADHLCKCLLADFRQDWFGFAFLPKIREKQEGPCQALLARIEQLVDQVRFNPESARQKMRDEHLGTEPEPTVPEKLPDPPEFLSVNAVNEWWRIVPELKALGLLSVLDVMPLAAYCDAYGRWVAAEQAMTAMAKNDQLTSAMMIKGSGGSPMANPLLKIARNAACDMMRFAGEFGMTPRARSYLSAAGRINGPGSSTGFWPDFRQTGPVSACRISGCK